MRKRTVGSFFDTVMWYLIYLLPFISVLFFYDNSLSFMVQLDNFLQSVSFSGGVVYDSLIELFYTGGIFPVFTNTTLLLYFSYFINLLIVHIVVDVLALIPRVCHKLLDKVVK